MAHVRTIAELHRELVAEDPACGLTRTALRRLVVTGQIPSSRVGKKYLISKEAVNRFLEAETAK